MRRFAPLLPQKNLPMSKKMSRRQMCLIYSGICGGLMKFSGATKEMTKQHRAEAMEIGALIFPHRQRLKLATERLCVERITDEPFCPAKLSLRLESQPEKQRDGSGALGAEMTAARHIR